MGAQCEMAEFESLLAADIERITSAHQDSYLIELQLQTEQLGTTIYSVKSTHAVYAAIQKHVSDLGLGRSPLLIWFGGECIDDDGSSFEYNNIQDGAKLFVEQLGLRVGRYVMEGNQVDGTKSNQYAAAVELTLNEGETVSGKHLDGGRITQGIWASESADEGRISYEVDYGYGVYRYDGTTTINLDSGHVLFKGQWACVEYGGNRRHRNIGRDNQGTLNSSKGERMTQHPF